MSPDGFVILSHIIQRGCPHLGGIGIDLYTYADQLKLTKVIPSFYSTRVYFPLLQKFNYKPPTPFLF